MFGTEWQKMLQGRLGLYVVLVKPGRIEVDNQVVIGIQIPLILRLRLLPLQ